MVVGICVVEVVVDLMESREIWILTGHAIEFKLPTTYTSLWIWAYVSCGCIEVAGSSDLTLFTFPAVVFKSSRLAIEHLIKRKLLRWLTSCLDSPFNTSSDQILGSTHTSLVWLEIPLTLLELVTGALAIHYQHVIGSCTKFSVLSERCCIFESKLIFSLVQSIIPQE